MENKELNLTPKQKRFCEEYVIDLNGTQAAIRAGYSDSGAGVEATRLLTNANVKVYVQELQADKLNGNKITAQMVIDELGKVAFSDIRELMTVDNALLDVRQLEDKAAASISSIEVDEIRSEGMTIGQTKKVKLWDKLRALDMLGKHFGVFEKDNSQKKSEIAININSDEEGLGE